MFDSRQKADVSMYRLDPIEFEKQDLAFAFPTLLPPNSFDRISQALTRLLVSNQTETSSSSEISTFKENHSPLEFHRISHVPNLP